TGAVHGRNRHRSMIEEAHEAHFGGALRIGTIVTRAADHQRARCAGRAVGPECQLVVETHRHRLAAAHSKINVEHLGFDFARLRPSGRTRIRSQRPYAPSVPAIRTSSCCRLPSRAALSRRNTASDTSGLPMKTRSTGRASCGLAAPVSARYAALE